MKKIISVIFIILCFVLPLSACSNNKYAGKYYNVLLGTETARYIELKSNGQFVSNVSGIFEGSGKYTIKDNVITLTYSKGVVVSKGTVYEGSFSENEFALTTTTSSSTLISGTLTSKDNIFRKKAE